MVLGIDPTVDYVFKRLFGDPHHILVLIHLLNAIFEGQFRIGGVKIETPFLDKDFEDDKLGVLDLRVQDTDGRNYNLEMQSTLQAGLPSRLAYYLSAMYCGQMREGELYQMLSPAISVCFLNQIMLPAISAFHTRFRLCSLEERIVLTDQLEVHLVELPKYNGTLADLPKARPMDRWAYFFRHAADMSAAEIGQNFGEPAFVEAAGVLDMIAKTPEERLRYEFRQKAIRDQASNLEDAHEKGIEKGEHFGEIRLLQKLLGDAVTPSEELRTWDIDRLTTTAVALQTRLRNRM